MGYAKDRDEFISIMTGEGLSLEVTRKLLRYAQTLHRLAVAQCNGDWPYNGDRDRPMRDNTTEADGYASKAAGDRRERWDKRYTVCPKCEASGVAKSAMKRSHFMTVGNKPALVCPDCRTTELVWILVGAKEHIRDAHAITTGLKDCDCIKFKPVFGGDPRGCVLKVQVPSGRNNSWGSKEPAICVPVRDR